MEQRQGWVIDWIDSHLNYDDAPILKRTAHGMITTDIEEFGFVGWLELPASQVVESYMETTKEVSKALVTDYTTIRQVDVLLEDLDIGANNYEIDDAEAMQAYHHGMMDIWESLFLYFSTREEAYLQYYSDYS